MSRKSIGILILLTSMVFSAGCSRQFGEGWLTDDEVAAGDVDQEKVAALMEQGDAAWAHRAEKASTEQAVKFYTEAADMDHSNYRALTMATRSLYVLADYHTDVETEKDLKLERYDTAVKYGERAMATDSKFKEIAVGGEKVEVAAQALGIDHIDAIYWTASALGKWAVNKGFVTLLGNKNKIKSLIEHVATLDDSYFYGAAGRYLGTYYAKAPSFAGGDLNKSIEYYTQSIETAPNYLGTHVLKAKFYCVKLQTEEEGGKECFKDELQYVLDTPADVIPDLVAENTMEKKKAEELITKVDDLFAY